VGACVDSVSGESSTTNNCSSAVQITVIAQPDLVVQSPSVDDTTLEPGQSFLLRATVRNSGAGGSTSTMLRYYRSTNNIISSLDTPLGTDFVSSLASGATSQESISVTAPTGAGTYYVGACVDSVSGESSTTNNCSSAVQITVIAQPDLVVQSPSVDDTTLEPGQSFLLRATVRNSGAGGSTSTTLRYYRSTNNIISSLDTPLGTDFVSSLASGATSQESISVTAPTGAGTYYVGACVDSVSGESSTTNNCSDPVPITVSPSNSGDVILRDGFE